VSVVELLATFIQINLFLAIFNLLPIPPFDGSHIVEGCCLRLPLSFMGGFVASASGWCWFCWCCCLRWCPVSIPSDASWGRRLNGSMAM
jgi:hypothetical protein